MPSRDTKDLHALMQPKAEAFKTQCEAAGILFIFTCTYRSEQEQDVEYAKGRTAPGPKVTNAKGGESPHNVFLPDGTPAALAFDVVPVDRDGKPIWDSTSAAWPAMGQIAETLGLVWGGHFVNLRDMPHVEYPNWEAVANAEG